ncbi:large repetitive protein [Salmonella enterica subsp. enterica]|uniref:Large repetitive protein n=1 Tax=Salmonella enterica I TaxID=59201 RepID=A0A3S4HT79_SALET|nr:large repetitive protein [Salmonella enterica subsp. enterica]
MKHVHSFILRYRRTLNSVQLSLDGGINWVNATLTSDGVWEYIWPTDLVENTYTLTVKATDVAGKHGDGNAQFYH